MKKLLQLILISSLASGVSAYAEDEPYQPWSKEAVQEFVSIPVQHEGRVMPMGTFAFTQLMTLRGKDSVKFEWAGEKHKIGYDEWLMDVFFRPEIAKKLPIFIVDDTQVIVAIGGVRKDKKRGDYSYADILPSRAKLAEMARDIAIRNQEAEQKKEMDQPFVPISRIDSLLMLLGQRANQYEFLASSLAFAKPGNLVNSEVLYPEMREMAMRTPISGLLERVPKMSMAELEQMIRQGPGEEADMMDFHAAMSLIVFYNRTAQSFRMFPPVDAAEKKWHTPGDLIELGIGDAEEKAWALERIGKLEAVASAAAGGDAADFQAKLTALNESITTDAATRGEDHGIVAEVGLYQGKLVKNSLVYFIIAFLVVCVSWGLPGTKFSKIACWIAIGFGVLGLGYLSYAIGLRCYIRNRPPVTNLYDTFLFIGATGFLFSVVIELMTRRLVAVSSGIFLAVACLFFSGKFLEINPGDNMAKLEAVLDTNYWLTIHVLVISIGYAVGLLAALAAHFGIVARFFLGKRHELVRTFTRIVYGTVCFSLCFSLAGTILGGIWANDSWGRFWGWDPKENGALMIVLWSLVITHLRWGGFIRDLGINAATIFLGCIISFSWFGVNAMGVGLHSYGFAAGIMRTLYWFWGIEAFFLLAALSIRIMDIAGKGRKDPPSVPAEAKLEAA